MPSSVVCLGGFMCSGKTSVGRVLAARLGRDFIDTDLLVESRAGMTVAEVFARLGEPRFRRMEREAVLEALDGEGRVVSLGGGALLDEGSRAEVLRRSFLVILDASPETVAKRAASGRGSRPLLNDGVRELMEARAEAYSSCHLRVSTDDLSVDAVAGLIIDSLPGAGQRQG